MLSSFRGTSTLMATLAVVPFLLSVLVHTARPSMPLVIPSPDRPALAFDQYLVDLGEIEPTTEVRGLFHFENRGRTTVEIREVVPSCGCLTPQISSHALAPGEVGRIVLRMQPASELPGRKEYYADVRYSDGQPRETRLTFRLEIPEQHLSVKPKALLVYQSGDQPTMQTLTVTDNRPDPARILGATVNSPFVQVRLQAERQEPGVGRQTEFEIAVSGELPVGEHKALVTIETSDPLSPKLRVPLLLHRRDAIKTPQP